MGFVPSEGRGYYDLEIKLLGIKDDGGLLDQNHDNSGGRVGEERGEERKFGSSISRPSLCGRGMAFAW